MTGTKATVRRFPAIKRRNTRCGIKPFKTKEILLQKKTKKKQSILKKNGQVIKTIIVSRKSRYFSGKN